MNSSQFKRIISTFADKPDDVEYSGGEAVFQIRDEVIQIELRQKDMSLYVTEDKEEVKAERWIVDRLARLPQLADRLIDYTTIEENFVNPNAELLNQLELNPEENVVDVENALETINQVLDNRSGMSTDVLYITSDAGEGKTTLINQLAKNQAQSYKDRITDWLLVPILLGGRPFLRFDDVVIASLVNMYRFRLFFWETFIEMVKLGVLIPAFDGFEEMFIESSTDEALSSLGNLLNQLDSSGSILIAARKAYFDYKSLNAQAKLHDTIKAEVSFSKLSIKRWSKNKFVEYAEKRKITDAKSIYETVEKKLGPNHPLLTRAVLIKRLLDVADALDPEELYERIGDTTKDYFSNFIGSIIDREVKVKWIDRSGSPAKPLLDIEEHHILLSMIAQEMWHSNSNSVNSDVLDLISDLFSETYKKNSHISNQIKERIKQHALLISTGLHSKQFSFDHDEFRQYFLGRALAENIIRGEVTETRGILRISLIASQTAETCVNLIKAKREYVYKSIQLLQGLCLKESQISFIRDNCGALIIRLVDRLDNQETINIVNMAFPSDALSCKQICNISFNRSYFKATSIHEAALLNCRFMNCTIERVGINEATDVNNVTLKNTTIESVIVNENPIFDPKGVNIILTQKGFTILNDRDEEIAGDENEYTPDEDLILTEKIIRKCKFSISPGDLTAFPHAMASETRIRI